MTGDQIRWGLENLNIDDKKLKSSARPASCRR